MLRTMIGSELDKTENSPRIKVLIKTNKRLILLKKKKQLSQKLIMLKKIDHTLPPSKIMLT